MVNGKIDGTHGENEKQVEVRAGGGRAEVYIRPARPGLDFIITKISTSFLEITNGAKQDQLPQKWVSFVDKIWY